MSDANVLLQHVAACSTGAGQPGRGYDALAGALQQYPGYKLFTILAIDWARDENQRIYTSSPEAYPCGGAKPLHRDSAFFRGVIQDRTSRICTNAQECRAAFADFELISALGCASAVNVPIVSRGATVGSLNLLHEAGWYTPAMVPVLTQFAALAAALLQPAHLQPAALQPSAPFQPS